MLDGDAASRPALFLRIVEVLLRAGKRRTLASVGYRAEPATYMTTPLNPVLDHIANHLDAELREGDLAEISGYTTSAFSRAFRRQTGMTFTAYVTALRVTRACRLLASSDRPITDICFDVGFNNVSNFNRRFLAETAMTPRAYRRHHRANAAGGVGPSHGNGRAPAIGVRAPFRLHNNQTTGLETSAWCARH